MAELPNTPNGLAAAFDSKFDDVREGTRHLVPETPEGRFEIEPAPDSAYVDTQVVEYRDYGVEITLELDEEVPDEYVPDEPVTKDRVPELRSELKETKVAETDLEEIPDEWDGVRSQQNSLSWGEIDNEPSVKEGDTLVRRPTMEGVYYNRFTGATEEEELLDCVDCLWTRLATEEQPAASRVLVDAGLHDYLVPLLEVVRDFHEYRETTGHLTDLVVEVYDDRIKVNATISFGLSG